jgi:iron complex outermembrane receptor protein
MIRLVGRAAPARGRPGAVRRALAGGALLAACAALPAPNARAADDVDPFALSPEQLFDATVILTSRSEGSVWESAAASYVLTNADIARSGATTLPEALRLVPGVQVARINASGWAISIRGFNNALANKLLVLIDGREVYDPLFSGVYWDIQDTALEDIERIEVVRGPGASLWGANAVNGVINIVTKKASDTQGALVSVAAGDMERGILTARIGGAVGDAVQWRIYGKYFDRAGQTALAGGDANDEWRGWRSGFRLDAAPGWRDTVTLEGEVYRSDAGQLRTVPQLVPPMTTVMNEDVVAEGANALGRWTHDFENEARLTTQLGLDAATRDQLTLRDERVTVDLDTQYEFPTFGAHDIVAGARYRNTNAEFTATPIISTSHAARRDELVSGFVQDEIELVPDRWRLTLGAKIEHNDYTGVEAQPNVRLQWFDEETQTAWASIARAVRTPTALEHEFTALLAVIPPGAPPLLPIPVTIELQPNPAFESEEVVAYEAGYRRRWTDSLEMDVSAFFNDYEGLGTSSAQAPAIVLTPPAHAVLGVLLTNMTAAEAYGVETVLNWRATDDLLFSANYSFLDLELHGPPPGQAFDAEAGEGRAPRNQASVRAQWDASDRLAIDGALHYVDALPNYAIDSHVRFDARLGWGLTDTLEVELVGQDLFDESHREFGAMNEVNATLIERSIFGRLTWRP